MRYVRTAEIPLAEIEVPKRLRPVNEDWTQALSEAMAVEGQKTPIEVVEQLKGKTYRLVAGGHRVAAAKILGWGEIRAEVKQPRNGAGKAWNLELALHEIDENLHRQELTPLDRAVFIGRRQEIYEALHPETKGGVAGAKAKNGAANEIVSFAAATAEKIGLGERTIQRATRIYKGLAPEVRERIAGSHLAGLEGDLYALTRYSPAQQAEIVDGCLEAVKGGAGPAYARVALFARALDGTAAPSKSPKEIQLTKMKDAWVRAGNPARKAFLEFLTEIGVVESYSMEHL